jgi:hypothetical protein
MHVNFSHNFTEWKVMYFFKKLSVTNTDKLLRDILPFLKNYEIYKNYININHHTKRLLP